MWIQHSGVLSRPGNSLQEWELWCVMSCGQLRIHGRAHYGEFYAIAHLFAWLHGSVGDLVGLLTRRRCLSIVSNIKVLSDKVEDVSSIEAWMKSVIKDGMTDEQKVLAAWLTTVRHGHRDSAPNEFLGPEKTVNDVIKQLNVYGYDAGPTGLLTLLRNMGFEARGWNPWRWGGGVEVK
jgi:hypothetical protein